MLGPLHCCKQGSTNVYSPASCELKEAMKEKEDQRLDDKLLDDKLLIE